MPKAFSRLLLALGASALAHFLLLHGNRFVFEFHNPPPPTLIEARLTPPPVAVTPLPTHLKSPSPKARPKPRPANPRAEIQQALAPATEEPVALPTEVSPAEPAIEAPAHPQALEPAPPPVANSPVMPRRIDIEFSVARSSGGSGIARHVWQRLGENGYTITSTLEATGIASLFMQGKYVQTSQGIIGEKGLQPQTYVVERRNKTQSARFDNNANRMIFSDGPEVDLPPDTQDLLSFTFQFAYNPPQRKSLNLMLTNGRKLGNYNYLVLDDETLSTPVGSIATVHLHKLHEPEDDGLEMWLAPDLFYAPVKMLRVEKDGTRYELNITSLKIES